MGPSKFLLKEKYCVEFQIYLNLTDQYHQEQRHEEQNGNCKVSGESQKSSSEPLVISRRPESDIGNMNLSKLSVVEGNFFLLFWIGII